MNPASVNTIDIFPWNENFNTGIAKIDGQHKKLVQLLNSLASHMAFRSDIPALNEIFDQLADYAVYHFQTEEAIWQTYFPEDQLNIGHKDAHNRFVETVVRLRAEGEGKPVDEVIGDLLGFLARWLAAHILESDRNLALVVLAMQSGLPLQAAKERAREQLSGSARVLIDIILSIYGSLSVNTLRLMREIAERRRDTMLLSQLSLAVEQSPSSILITDLAANIEFVNEAFIRVTGYTRGEVLGRNPRLLQSGKTPDETYREMWRKLTAGEIWQGEFINKRKDGTEYIESAFVSPVRQADGTITHYIATKEDITERKKVEARLTDSEARLRAIFDSEPECIKIVGAGGELLQMNPAGLAMVEADRPEHVLGRPVLDLIAPEHRSAFATLHERVMAGEPMQMEYEIIGLKCGRRWMETRAVPMQEGDGRLVHLAVSRDITERKRAEDRLRIAATVFESQEGMMVTDANNLILQVNKAFCDITGYSAGEVIGKNPRILQSGRQDADFYTAMWERIGSTGRWEGEIWNRRCNGEIYPAYLTITAVKNQAADVTHYVGTFTDITLRKSALEEIEHLAYYDFLTGLPNRRLLRDRLQVILASMDRHRRGGALLFIDLDNFKVLNDTLGHDRGDRLLQQVAERLLSCVRQGDTVARLGGDEFIVMLDTLDDHLLEAAVQVEAVGKNLLALFHEPFRLDTHCYSITPSIGAILFNGDEQSTEELLKRADIAMYQAKSSGRNALRFFDPKMQDAIAARAAMEAELVKALAEGEFLLHYQVQVAHGCRGRGGAGALGASHPGGGSSR